MGIGGYTRASVTVCSRNNGTNPLFAIVIYSSVVLYNNIVHALNAVHIIIIICIIVIIICDGRWLDNNNKNNTLKQRLRRRRLNPATSYYTIVV